MESVRTFEKIVIIFNPNSTGDAPKLAEGLRDRLTELLTYMVDLKLQPTGHAGHAVELAREAASSGGDVLVVSVSGDGGYNEVVNGVKQSGNPNAVCAVMAAGTPMITGGPPALSRWKKPSPKATCGTSIYCGSTRARERAPRRHTRTPTSDSD